MRPVRHAYPAVFFFSAMLFVACAADPGDAAKLAQSASVLPPDDMDASGSTLSRVDTGPGVVYGSADTSTGTVGGDSSLAAPPQGDAAAVNPTADAGSTPPPVDSGSTPPPVDSGSTPPPVDSGSTTRPVDASTPVVDAGTPDARFTGGGCASGAAVVPLAACPGNTKSIMSGTAPMGTVCVVLHGSVPGGWVASNTGMVGGSPGCAITVTGATTETNAIGAQGKQGALAAGADGFIYWNLAAGCIDYAAIGCY